MQNSQWTYEQSNGSSNGTVIVLVCLRVLGIIKHKNQKHLLGQNFALIVKAQLSRSEIVKEGLDKRKGKERRKKGLRNYESLSDTISWNQHKRGKEEKKKSLEFGGFNLSKKERKKSILLKKKSEEKVSTNFHIKLS